MIRGGSEPREPARSADEQDVVGGWRHIYVYTGHSKTCARIKRALRRRERRRLNRIEDDD